MDDELQDGARAVCLALEGGGALGAFTWGVLDRLLEEPGLRIAAVSGTSAGAMNGAMLVQGLAVAGRTGAAALLETFWHRVAIASGSMPGMTGGWMSMLSGAVQPMLEAVRQAGSALGASGFASNPLRGILTELLNPPRFGADGVPALLVAATRVRTGEARVFRGPEVTVDALLASACLPMLFPAVPIEGEAYWDGGYSSNPPVRALLEDPAVAAPADVIVVRTRPEARAGLPLGQAALRDRIEAITFGTPLRGELRSLAIAQSSLSDVAGLPGPLARLRSARVHMIQPADADVAVGDALHPSWPMLEALRRRGRAAAERWLAAHRDEIGRRSSVSLAPYLDGAADAGQDEQERAEHAT